MSIYRKSDTPIFTAVAPNRRENYGMQNFLIINRSIQTYAYAHRLRWLGATFDKSKRAWVVDWSIRNVGGRVSRLELPGFDALTVLITACRGGGFSSMHFAIMGNSIATKLPPHPCSRI